jgi:hypothetical protein
MATDPRTPAVPEAALRRMLVASINGATKLAARIAREARLDPPSKGTWIPRPTTRKEQTDGTE